MSFRFCLLVALLFLLAAVPFAATAQQTGAAAGATVHGLVTDPDDALVPGATVTLTPASGRGGQTTPSQSDGTYTFRGVAPGTYSVTVTAPGFAAYVKEGIVVAANVNLAVDTKLAIQEQSQQVSVTADSVQLSVDPENNASSTVLTGAALDALSDDPDELQSELTALAGPSAGPNGGQIYIDGFTGGQLPPKSSILAIRINQNPFSAQYDQVGYGRIEIITKPGTDKFHGNASFNFADKFLNTSSPFVTSQPPYHTLFFMGNVTGPIRTGMSFTLSGSHRTIDSNAIINPTAFYAASATSTTLCAPGTVTGCTSVPFPEGARALANPADRWEISPRLDMLIGQKNTLTARFQYETGGNNYVIPTQSALFTNRSNSNSSESTLQLSDTQLFSSRIINETRFEYQHTSNNSTPINSGPSINVQGTFSAGGTGGGGSSNSADHIEVQNYTSIQLTKNFVRLGGRLRSSGESSFSEGGTSGSFTYAYLLDPCTDPNQTKRPSNCVLTQGGAAVAPCASVNSTISSYQCGIVNQFSLKSITNPTINARETDLGLYAEDDWKVNPNLTVSYGIRLEAQNVINSSHDFAPRISIAYGIPRRSGKITTVLRGGFGIFYDRFSLGSIAGQIASNGQNSISTTYTSPALSCKPTLNGSTFTNYDPSCTSTAGTTPRTIPSVLGPGLRSPYNIQTALTVEQQIGKYTSLTVSYLNAHGEHQFLTRTLPTGSLTTSPLQSVEQSGGVYRQNQINTTINIRTPKGIQIFGNYSANWADSNISNITDPFHSNTDYGRASFGGRGRLNVGGTIPLPYHISASPLIYANAGSPYNVTTGIADPVTTSFNDRPAFSNSGTFNCRSASSFNAGSASAPIPLSSEIPVNYCTGPANVSVNLRLSRTWGFGPMTEAGVAAAARAARASAGGGPGGGGFGGGGGGFGGGGGRGGGGGGGGRGGGGGGGGRGANTGRRYNLTLGAQAQNLFNQIPYGTPQSSLTNPNFGQVTSLQGGVFSSDTAVRRITLQANFNF